MVHGVEHNRPAVEVREAIDKLKGAYEILIEKHEDYTKLIEDDAVYENEEEWMTECQERFLRLEVDAKMFIESKARSSASYVDLSEGQDDASKTPLDHNKGISNMQSVTPQASEESQCISSNHQALPEDSAQQSISTANDQHNQAINEVINSSLNYSGPSTSTTYAGTCTFKLERPKLLVFAGNVRDYAIFRSDFKHAIEAKYSKRDAITLLRTCLRDKPFELIKGLGSDYDAAWEYLDALTL